MHVAIDTRSGVREQDHPSSAIFGSASAPAPRTLVDIFDATVERFPDAIALESQTRALSYQDLSIEVSMLAQRLRAAGIGRGSRVGVRVPSGTSDLYVAILGVLRAGAAYVPVDWDDPEQRAETVFTEAEVAAVIGQDLEVVAYSSLSAAFIDDSFIRGDDPLAAPTTAQVPLSESPHLETVLPDPPHPGVAQSADPGGVHPGLSDDAWIIFTSGSTGRPKGVAITHRSAAALVDAETELYLVDAPLGPGDRVMAGLSVAFDASCEEMWLAWRSGAALVTAPRHIVRSGPDLGDWIVEQRITAVSTVPTLASLWPAESLDRVRLLIFGGEACPLELIARLDRPGRELWNTYGPTEATVIATGMLMTPEPPVRIGLPICGWQLAVIDPATGDPVGWGEEGELVIGGVGLGRYLDPEKDAEKYAPLPSLGWDRCYRTGDMVTADRDGLIFAGRIDDQIKLGGKRLELGEVDRYLSELPGVNFGAAALQKTAGGADVLVGYLTENAPGALDLDRARRTLADKLSAGVAPILTVVDELPMKTSGKVDRKALPWPLVDVGGADTDLSPSQKWLKDLWIDQLGPVGIDLDTNFFTAGGGSVQVARLVAQIRRSHPNAEIGALYDHPTLESMSGYIDSLRSTTSTRDMPDPLPLVTRIAQVLFVASTYALNGLRYVVATVAVVWALSFFFDAGWVPEVPFVPVFIGWAVLFSVPGRVAQAVFVCRVLTAGVRPGIHRRGGWTHVRLWAAERFYTFLNLDIINGTRLSVLVFRMLGNVVGRDTYLACVPPTSGLAVIGDRVTVERDADLRGYWIEGGMVHVDRIRIDDDARIGTRSTLEPGVAIGRRSEILPGANVDISVACDETWGGSPLTFDGPSGLTWPRQEDRSEREKLRWSAPRTAFAEFCGMTLVGILPVIALAPSVAIVLPRVIDIPVFPEVALVLAAWVPLTAVLTAATWLALVIIIVRALAGLIQPGYFRQDSACGWAVWLTQAVLDRTLVSAYPIYASSATPVFLRCLGARVGKNTEISTLEFIPHLTWIQDGAFVADNALVNTSRHFRGWIHLGTTVVGSGSFVGNSAVVGPDTDLPGQTLIAVSGSTPRNAPVGSSWLGGTARAIPRIINSGDDLRTFRPPLALKWARAGVESLRILPFMITNLIELVIVLALNSVYMNRLIHTDSVVRALGATVLAAVPVVAASGVLSVLIAVAAKWVLVGKFAEKDRPLFSSFVWRNELADVFAESLAVSSLIKTSIGSPIMNWYASLMGTRVGRSVWCETWWLPEFDLIELGDCCTVNRGTVVQTHLFHDRVMTMVATGLQAGATLGVNSFMLPGSTIGERTVVGNGSLVLRDENLPADTYWQGNPVAYLETDPES